MDRLRSKGTSHGALSSCAAGQSKKKRENEIFWMDGWEKKSFLDFSFVEILVFFLFLFC